MRLLIATFVASFHISGLALASDEPRELSPDKGDTYAAFRVLTKCAVTTAVNEKQALTLQSFRELYIKLCREPERDFLSKFVGTSRDPNVRVPKMAQGGKMINEMVKQAFERTRKLRGE
jgi:hypothetical protein